MPTLADKGITNEALGIATDVLEALVEIYQEENTAFNAIATISSAITEIPDSVDEELA